MKKNKRYGSQYLVAAGISLLLLTAVFQLSARTLPGFGTWYAHHIYSWIVKSVGRLTGLLPFSVVEMGLYGLLCLLFLDVVRLSVAAIRAEHAKILTVTGRRWLLIVSALLFLYTVNCGINYYASSFSSYAGLEDGTYTVEELEALCSDLVELVNESAKTGRQSYREHRSAWRVEAVTAMQAAGEQFSCLAGFYPKPKEVLVSRILSVQQLCGVYSPFTVEANYNGDMPDYNVPHTLCHELSHLKGFMREDEANFISYLACYNSDNTELRYSGAMMGLIHATNRLYRYDPNAWQEIYTLLPEGVLRDLAANSRYWKKYETPVGETADRWNDAYLKANDQTDGVQSYGRMVDLLIAFYRAQGLI